MRQHTLLNKWCASRLDPNGLSVYCFVPLRNFVLIAFVLGGALRSTSNVADISIILLKFHTYICILYFVF